VLDSPHILVYLLNATVERGAAEELQHLHQLLYRQIEDAATLGAVAESTEGDHIPFEQAVAVHR
jgi:hypothetical protein